MSKTPVLKTPGARPATADAFVSGGSATGPKPDMKRFTVDLPVAVHRAAKAKAAAEGRMLSDIVREAFDAYLKP